MEPTEPEWVNHPDHYGGEENPYEAIKVIESRATTVEFHVNTALRYMLRGGSKPGQPLVRDLEKAAWYIDRAVRFAKHLEAQAIAREQL